MANIGQRVWHKRRAGSWYVDDIGYENGRKVYYCYAWSTKHRPAFGTCWAFGHKDITTRNPFPPPKRNVNDDRHLSCSNWPNCDIAGCGFDTSLEPN